MKGVDLIVRPYAETDRTSIIALWKEVFADDPPWNAPAEVIRRKLKVQPELFLVGQTDGKIVATVLAGYDGVRGWIHHLAVSPALRRRGIATRMMRQAEIGLAKLGCVKINLQVRPANSDVAAFYRALGYEVEERVSMGKRLDLVSHTEASVRTHLGASAFESYRASFDSLDWQSPLPGARFKVFRSGNKQMRLAEFTPEFVEPDWCEKGHAGFVVNGELEVDFHGTVVRYSEGSGIMIPAGRDSGHKARAITPLVRLFLVEHI